MFTRTRVRRLAWGTAGFTFLLILLGRYTALTGAGLACAAQWPLCSGGTLPQTLDRGSATQFPAFAFPCPCSSPFP